MQAVSHWYVPPLRDQKSPLTPRRIYDPQGTQGYVTDRHEYQPTNPLSLRERVGVRVIGPAPTMMRLPRPPSPYHPFPQTPSINSPVP